MTGEHTDNAVYQQITILVPAADIIIDLVPIFAKVMKHSHDAHIICFTLKEKLVALLITKDIPTHHPFRHMDSLAVYAVTAAYPTGTGQYSGERRIRKVDMIILSKALVRVCAGMV